MMFGNNQNTKRHDEAYAFLYLFTFFSCRATLSLLFCFMFCFLMLFYSFSFFFYHQLRLDCVSVAWLNPPPIVIVFLPARVASPVENCHRDHTLDIINKLNETAKHSWFQIYHIIELSWTEPNWSIGNVFKFPKEDNLFVCLFTEK